MTFVKLKRNPGLETILNEVFNSSIADVAKNDFAKNRPATNVIQTADALILEMAIPGLGKEDIDINVEKDLLKISSKKEKEEKENQGFVKRQFDYSNFSRSFKIPETINRKAIEAAYHNGILSITLNKKEEAKDMPAKTIKVK